MVRRPLDGIQDGWNCMGLLLPLSERKEAFYLLQVFYNKYKYKLKTQEK